MGEQLQYGYFGHIAKFEKTEDGTLMVYGKAAGPDLDLDEQVCDEKWLKTAMPNWYQWGNVRGQHANVAAGVGVELAEEGDSNYFIKAEIVDPNEIRKVEKRVYKGFSVGIMNGRVIKDAKARGGRIVDGTIHEISLVDRPANATCMLSIAKSVDGVKLEPVEAEAEDTPDAPFIEPRGPQTTEGVLVEKSVDWYRESLRLVEDTLAGRWSRTVPFISKAATAASDGDQAEVTGAYAAMDQILDLIIAEAGQAKGGRVKELRDIEVLLSACRSLCCFIECEQDEGMTGEVDDGDIDLAYMAEGAYAKAFGIWGADDEAVRDRLDKGAAPVRRRTPRRGPVVPESTAGDTADDAATVEAATAEIITKAVAAAQAESAQAHEAELATLRAQLEKAQAAPLTGGPVTFSTVLKTSSAPSQTVSPTDSAHWRKLAEDPNLSPDVRRAYIAKAASLSQGAST